MRILIQLVLFWCLLQASICCHYRMVLHDDVGMQTMLLVLCLIVRSDKKSDEELSCFSCATQQQHSKQNVQKALENWSCCHKTRRYIKFMPGRPRSPYSTAHSCRGETSTSHMQDWSYKYRSSKMSYVAKLICFLARIPNRGTNEIQPTFFLNCTWIETDGKRRRKRQAE